MNIQPGKSSRKRTTVKEQNRNQGDSGAFGVLFIRMVRMALGTLILGAFFHTYIKLDQDINVASEEIAAVNSRIGELDRQIQVLDNRYEECCTLEFIENQIARFNLPLVELRQDQQILMRLYTNEQLARVSALKRNYHRTADNNRNRSW